MRDFYSGKKILIIGHVTFRGTWLSLVLNSLGAEVLGVSFDEPKKMALHKEIDLDETINSKVGDITDYFELQNLIGTFNPEIIIYISPTQSIINEVEIRRLYSISVLGVLNVLEFAKQHEECRLFINLVPAFSLKNEININPRKNKGELELIKGSFKSAEFLTSGYRGAYAGLKNYLNICTPEVIGGGDWSKLSIVNEIFEATKSLQTEDRFHENYYHQLVHILDAVNGVLGIVKNQFNQEKISNHDLLLDPGKAFIANEFDLFYYVKGIMSGEHTENCLNEINSYVKNKQNVNSGYWEDSTWMPKLSLEKSINWYIEWENARERGANMMRYCMKQIENFNSIN